MRLRARECHAAALARTQGDRTAAALVAAAVAERELVIAHGIARHEFLDGTVASIGITGTAWDGPDAVAPMGWRSPRDGHEVVAETFAAEFLCPTDRLRADLLSGRGHVGIADELGLPGGIVARQALRALVLPPPRPASPPDRAGAELDASQLRAATWDAGPLFVEAGPGTGKTATLVGRIGHLLATGVPAEAILVMTFSRGAADELRGRITAAAPDAAADMWIGTVHSFGLEVLLASHDRAGLPPHPRVLDRDAALSLLESRLGELPLRHFRDPPEPAVGLAPVLRVIERCKDGMVTAKEYAAAAREAATEGDGPTVEAIMEVAAIYRVYQDALDGEGAVDLGDLVMRATALFEEHDDVAAHWGRRFRHVLVDEYQDLNVAGVRLLSSLCGPGTVPWVVGDGRQSIHRFRGAHPDAAATFIEAFGGTTVSLDRNYRSRVEVVRAFAAFSSTMRGGAGDWTAHRGCGGGVRVSSAPSLAGEAAAIRDRIVGLSDAGIAHADQAVIARTHLCLDRVGAELEHLGVPVLHVGDPFRRPEIRDLLAVLAVAAGDLVAVVRAAALPPYSVPRRDAAAAVRWATSHGLTVAALLRRADEAGVVAASAAGLSRLGCFLDRLGARATASSILVSFLLDERAWLEALVTAGGARARMDLVAIHLLLGIAATDAGDAARFLARVRRISALGEGRAYGTVPAEADDGTSVRMLTIHAAKGLEFAAVHLAMATSRHLPFGRRPDACPPPPGLAHLAMSSADHDAEERALAFVALSRARDHLAISHARRYGDGREVRPSPYLARLGRIAVERHVDPPPVVPAAGRPGEGRVERGGAAHRHLMRDLLDYIACPARYRHGVVDGLGSAARPSAHGRTRRAVACAVEELERIASLTGGPAVPDEVERRFGAAWAVHGPLDHAFEAFHRAMARGTVAGVADAIADEGGAVHHHDAWEVDVGAGTIVVRADRVVAQPWGRVIVQELLFAPLGGLPTAGPLHALLWLGARERFPDHPITVEAFDAERGERHAMDIADPEVAVLPFADAVDGIARGRFPARPGPARARCPYLLVCGA